jgi:hypothetical protein
MAPQRVAVAMSVAAITAAAPVGVGDGVLGVEVTVSMAGSRWVVKASCTR